MNTQRNADLLEKLKLRKSARLLARALAVGANSKEGGGLFLGQVVPVRGAGRAGSGGTADLESKRLRADSARVSE